MSIINSKSLVFFRQMIRFHQALFIILFSFVSVFSQTAEKCACSKKDKEKVKQYFKEIKIQNKVIDECTSEISLNAKIVSVDGFFPKAISLVKPYYPNFAREHKISGQVLVEIIFDENGFVIYAKAFKGHKVLRKYAEKAACASKFTPVQYCDKPVKQRRIVLYNFILL